MASVWVTMSSLRRLTRSATSPATGPKSKMGIWLMNPVSPSSNGDPVMRNTSQFMATNWIQVPINEQSWPMK